MLNLKQKSCNLVIKNWKMQSKKRKRTSVYSIITGIYTNNDILKTILRLDSNDRSEIWIWNSNNYRSITNRNTEHEKLAEFDKSQRAIDEFLINEQLNHYDFAYSLKDDGVKTKIIKKYIPIINQQVNHYLIGGFLYQFSLRWRI